VALARRGKGKSGTCNHHSISRNENRTITVIADQQTTSISPLVPTTEKNYSENLLHWYRNPTANSSTCLARHGIPFLQNHPPLTPTAAVLADAGPVFVAVPADVVELTETPFFGDFFVGFAAACERKRSVSMDLYRFMEQSQVRGGLLPWILTKNLRFLE
jgi:hypothetical protein